MAIILITGHVCSGKSTLSSLLLKNIPNSCHIDIAYIHAKCPNPFKEVSLTTGTIEERAVLVYDQIFTSLLSGKIPVVELLGEEPWFFALRKMLLKAWVRLVQVELQRDSIKTAMACLSERNRQKGHTSAIVQQVEGQQVQNQYGRRYNLSAKHFTVSGVSIKEPFKYIMELLDESNQY